MALYMLGIGVGLFLLAAALFNWESLFVDYDSRVLELLGGEGAVRWCWGIAGVALIGITIFYWVKA